jgi:hypothetical protein
MAYPVNVGGKGCIAGRRSFRSFECTILVAALSAVLGMLALNGLPMPYHPVFNAAIRAGEPQSVLPSIEAKDPKFNLRRRDIPEARRGGIHCCGLSFYDIQRRTQRAARGKKELRWGPARNSF